MSQSRNISRISTGSEAIVHHNGTLKTRFATHETRPGTSAQNRLHALSNQAANDANESHKHTTPASLSVSNESNFIPLKRPASYIHFFIMAIVIAIFAWSVQSLYLKDKPGYTSSSDNNLEAENIDTIAVVENDKENIKNIAESILDDNDWNEDRIHSFLTSWNQLDEKATQQVTQSSWYKLFTSHLKQKVKSHPGLIAIQNAVQDHDPLLTLALVTGVLNDTGNESPDKSKYSQKYSQLINEITKEISKAEIKSRTNTKVQESEAELNARIKQLYSYIPPAKSGIPEPTKKIGENTTVPETHDSEINISEINSVLKEYARYYVAGDVDSIMHMFNPTNSSLGVLEQQKLSLKTIFDNSIDRSINFYDTQWKLLSDFVDVTSRYNSSIEFKQNKGTQFVVAAIQLKLKKINNTIFITEFNVIDRKVNVVAKQNTVIAPPKPVEHRKNSDLPTTAELNDITTQLVTAYDSGDLSKFLSLLSSDIKTNDQNTLAGVQKDYEDLFNSTSQRQMFIQDMKWQSEKFGVKGTGDMEVTVSGKEGSGVYTMTGKIEIVAQKRNGKVLITHLYHIERAK